MICHEEPFLIVVNELFDFSLQSPVIELSCDQLVCTHDGLDSFLPPRKQGAPSSLDALENAGIAFILFIHFLRTRVLFGSNIHVHDLTLRKYVFRQVVNVVR